MASVSSNIECPKCKSKDCLLDIYYKIGEEYLDCPDCGYSEKIKVGDTIK
jgi:hypothetical protein